jgi:hypothetical protein
VQGGLATQVADQDTFAVGHEPNLVPDHLVVAGDPAVFFTITLSEKWGEKVGVRESKDFGFMAKSDGLQQGLIHPHEPPLGVFDEEIDVRKHIKQLAQRVFGNETRQEGFLEFLSLVAMGGSGGFVAHFHVNQKRNGMRRKYKKSRVSAKQNGSVSDYNDASKNFDP